MKSRIVRLARISTSAVSLLDISNFIPMRDSPAEIDIRIVSLEERCNKVPRREAHFTLVSPLSARHVRRTRYISPFAISALCIRINARSIQTIAYSFVFHLYSLSSPKMSSVVIKGFPELRGNSPVKKNSAMYKIFFARRGYFFTRKRFVHARLAASRVISRAIFRCGSGCSSIVLGTVMGIRSRRLLHNTLMGEARVRSTSAVKVKDSTS